MLQACCPSRPVLALPTVLSHACLACAPQEVLAADSNRSIQESTLWVLVCEARADKWGWRAQKWEAHLREERGGQGAGGPGAAQAAWARWAGVSRKARLVLKRASPEQVAVLELPLLHFLDQVMLCCCRRSLCAWAPLPSVPLGLPQPGGAIALTPC